MYKSLTTKSKHKGVFVVDNSRPKREREQILSEFACKSDGDMFYVLILVLIYARIQSGRHMVSN